MDFVTEKSIYEGSWQSFERMISRLLTYEGFENVRLVGGSGDNGADVIATKFNKRWLFQAKQWKKPVGLEVIEETLHALAVYNAQIPVIVASHGFDNNAYQMQRQLMTQGIRLQLWNAQTLLEHFNRVPNQIVNSKPIRDYQENAIQSIVQAFVSEHDNKALIVLATGLGKTFVAAEAIRRMRMLKPLRLLVLAHANPLVSQLEKAFWQFLRPTESTVVWNGNEKPSEYELKNADCVFACVDTVGGAIDHFVAYDFDVIIVDECHHAGSSTYKKVLSYYSAGKKDGPFLIGLTATPWRKDEEDIKEVFGDPRISIDMVFGMKNGFLTNVDYRVHIDNIRWENLRDLDGNAFSPRQINRTLFINQWDDAVVEELRKVWYEQSKPRAIVFCGTIEHAITMRDRINALGFCRAEAIFSAGRLSGEKQSLFEKNRLLSDFSDGIVNVICTVDVFNEGIDVPDVNIIVFQRVTHSRRIFIQQLGRGLRISDDKDKVIVLDFVSDVRRIAADIDLSNQLIVKEKSRIDIPNKVVFKRVGGEDPQAESFLREWLEDVASIENAGEDDPATLKFPPAYDI